MITYVGMTVPMAILSLITWLKNPFKGKHAEVKINNVQKKEVLFLCLLATVVTIVFYFTLKYFNTANLIVSTVSVSTSFIAAYLTMRRSPFFALAYAVNDIVLIVLWIMASIVDISYLSVIICFSVFLFNDLYSFINWQRMQKRQKKS
jgi:nicotinamide mononucleotide transporter PnuC